MTRCAFRQAVLFVAVIALTLSGGAADNVAVVIDVSGSMRTYGPWQSDAKDAITAILAGGPLPARWSLIPSGADLSAYACRSPERATLLRFGSVQPADEYPYFDKIQNSLSPADLEAQFPINPGDYSSPEPTRRCHTRSA